MSQFKKIIYLVIFISLLANAYIMLDLSVPKTLYLLGYSVGFYLWNALPYMALGLGVRYLIKTPKQAIALGLGSLATGAFGISSLIDSLYFSADAQSALVILALPIILSVPVAVTLILTALLGIKRKQKDTH